ncbi:hypothetical protein [Cedecea sp. NFIX57]|uniref:hypothetical protein n=1 Tax=Cedecea sp. NFIX57 TaxID=1566286 RepID=UPI00111C0305|nr:hypothetical protein [Cedecea sp. NFIX57]
MRKERRRTFDAETKEPVIARIAQLARKHPSRSAAARAWGINVNTLNSYYKSEANPPMPRENILLRIAESEGVDLKWLIDGEGKSPETPKPSKNNNEGDKLSEVLSFLTDEERLQLATMLARKGVETVLYLLDEDNIDLLRMDPIVKEKILGRQPDPVQEAALNVQEKRERDTDGELQTTENDLANIAKKKQAR